MAGNGFNTNYVIAVTLEGLDQLKALRQELQLLRQESSRPIDFNVNVGSGPGRSSSGGGLGGSGAKVDIDTRELEKAIETLTRTMQALTSEMRSPGPGASAAPVAGPTSRVVSQPMSETRRKELKGQLNAFNDVKAFSDNTIDKFTELDVDKMGRELQKQAKLIGGKFQKEVDAHLRRTAEAVSRAMDAGFSDSGNLSEKFTKGKDGDINRQLEQVAGEVSSRVNDIAEANLHRMKDMLRQSQRLLNERFSQLDSQLTAGVEERVEVISSMVGTGAFSGGGGINLTGMDSLNRKILATMRLASRGLNKSLETLANRMSEVVAAKMDALVSNIANINVTAMMAPGEFGASGAMGGGESLPVSGAATPFARRAFGGLRKRKQATDEQRAAQAAKRYARREAKLTELYERMDPTQRKQFETEADLGRVYFDKPEQLGIPSELGGRKGIQGAIAYMMRQGAGRLQTRAGTMSEHIGDPMPGAQFQRITKERIEAASDNYRKFRTLGKVARSQGDFEASRSARENAARAIREFREMQEQGRIELSMYGGLDPDVAGKLYGARGPRPWDPDLEEERRRQGVSPRRASAMASSMLRNATELEQRTGPGVAMSIGMAGGLAKRLGSAASVLRNLREGHQEFGKFDAKTLNKYGRIQREDEFLRFVLPENVTPGNVGGLLDDVISMQTMFQEKADMAAMITMNKRHGTPGYVKAGAGVLGAKGMDFQPYPDEIKEALLERMKLLEKLQFSRTPQMQDNPDAVLALGHRIPAGLGARPRKNRPAQAYYDKNQMSYNADYLAAMYSSGGESYSGEFTGFHRLNDTLERMNLPPIRPKAAEAAAAAGGGGGGGSVPPAPPGGGGGGGGFNFGDMDPSKAEAIVAALKQLESVRLTGLANDLKQMAVSMSEMAHAAASDPRMMGFINAQAEKEIIALRAAKKIEMQGGTMMDLQGGSRRQLNKEAFEYRQTLAASKVGQRLSGQFGLVGAGPEMGRQLGELARIFVKREGQLGNSQLGYEDMLALNDVRPLPTRVLSNKADDVYARRQGLFKTLKQVGGLAPKWFNSTPGGDPSVADLLEQYDASSAKRVRAEKSRTELTASGTPDPVRAARLNAVIKGRVHTEDELTKAILSRSSADMHAIVAAEKQITFVDRLAGKIKTLSAYAGAGLIIYGAASAIRSAFDEAVAYERQLFRIAGLSGMHGQMGTMNAGLMGIAQQYGTPVSAVAQTAEMFARTGGGPASTLARTQAAMVGQVGLGLDPERSTQMILAVENMSRNLVTASTIVDRIAKLSSEYAASPQDLSNAVQRAGPLAMQLQPHRIGDQDALDMVLASSAAIMSKTQMSGDQAGTSLRMIMARMLQPNNANALQKDFGIKLGGSTPNELRPIVDILGDISKLYKQLVSKGATGPAAQLLETVAGTRQANAAAALFDNWDEVLKGMQDSAHAWGDSQQRLILQMNTLSFTIDRAKSSFFNFFNTLLQQTGIMGGFRGLMSGAGTFMNATAPYAGLMPLAAGVTAGAAAPLIGRGAAFLKGRTAAAAVAIGEGSMTETVLASSFMANITSFGTKLGAAAAMVAEWLLPIGGILAALAAGVALFGKIKNIYRGDFGESIDVGAIKGRMADDPTFKSFSDFAIKNGMTSERLQKVIGSSVSASESAMYGRSAYASFKQGPGFFAGAGSATKRGLREDMTQDVVQRMVSALPELQRLPKDQQQDKVFQLMQQAQLVSGGVAEGVQSAEMVRLDQRRKEIEANLASAGRAGRWVDVRGPTGPETRYIAGGAFGESVSGGSVIGGLASVFGKEAGGGIGGASINVAGQQTTMALAMVATRANTVGEAFDRVANAAFSLSDAEEKRVAEFEAAYDKLPGMPKVGDKVFDSFGLSANERRVAGNRISLQQGLYDAMVRDLPKNLGGPAAGGSGIGQTGGNVVFQAWEKAVQKIAKTMEASNPALARQLRAAEGALGNPDNANQSFLDLSKAGSEGRAGARDRLLEQLLTYGSARSRADIGGRLMVGAGVSSIDINQQRMGAASGLLEGLINTRVEIEGDVLRSKDREARQKVLLESLGKSGYGKIAGIISQGGELNPEDTATKNAITNSDVLEKLAQLSGISGENKNSLAMRTKSAESARDYILKADKGGLFAGWQDKDKKVLLDITKLRELDLKDMAALEAGAQRLVREAEKRLVAEQNVLNVKREEMAMAEARLRISNEEAQVTRAIDLRSQESSYTNQERTEALRRGFGITMAEVQDGRGAAMGLVSRDIIAGTNLSVTNIRALGQSRISDRNQRAQAALAEAKHSYDSDLAVLEVERQNILNAAGLRNAELPGLREKVRARGVAYDVEKTKITGSKNIDIKALEGSTQQEVVDKLTEASRNLTDVVQHFYADTYRAVDSRVDAGAQSLSLGARANLLNYDTLKGPALAPRLYKPALDSFSGAINNSFFDHLLGPQGIFSDQLKTIFSQPFLMEAQLIRDAHISGITLGFAKAGQLTNGSGITKEMVGDLTPEQIAKLPPDVQKQIKDGTLPSGALYSTGDKWKQLAVNAALMGGTLIGGAVGTKNGVNRRNNYGSEGAQIGTMAGSLVGALFGPMGAGIGGGLGGLLGGIFGGRVGKHAPPPEFVALDSIARNTKETVTAIENQTKLLTLSDRLVNVPTGFRIPSYSIGGGTGSAVGGDNMMPDAGMGANIVIHVNGATSPTVTADAVTQALREELFGQGKFRSTRSR